MISRLHQGVLLIIVAANFLPVTAQINLALHGTVKQETTYTVSGVSYDANVAIEGPAINNWEDGCSSTGHQSETWWGLFLQRLAYITNVKAYYRKDEAHRMNDFRLYFANGSVYEKTELCFRDTGNQSQINLNQSIDCNLSPTRNIYYFNRNTYIELCYIEINGCWKGFGEKTVQYLVHLHVLTNIVILQMGAVFGDVTLVNVCKIVWSVQASALEDVNSDEQDNIVINSIVLIPLTSGLMAFLLYSGKRLDTDITIFAVCKYLTYVPPMLSGNNMVELCEIEIGGCPYRRYGDKCEHVCPENCLGQGQCDLISGNCLSGCSDGWVGEQCDQGCLKGTWGTNCTDTCSSKCINQDCYPGNGYCVLGCDPQNCRNNNCNNQTSVCTEGCVDGLNQPLVFIVNLLSSCVSIYLWNNFDTGDEFAALINRVYNTGTRHP
ncbi:unnamed protein product [Mytilus edulis]|uniref:Fucolectin-related molecule n=1 Tax=Mytilus edulis TaxID=6550 RepID=A0A8S3PMS1_MYTED|nr:unnamed protein product [Mytilus edulis]